MAFVPLNALTTTSADEMRQRLGEGGCSSTSCGSDAGAGELPPEVWEQIKDHPCYSEEAHHYFARMHVAVAPACNIQCNYCNRKYDCANESRPGVVSEKLTPGSGDAQGGHGRQRGAAALGARHRRAGRRLLRLGARPRRPSTRSPTGIPDIKLCISTNGLALPDHVDELAAMNVDHVTITINMVDPEIGAKIYPWIFYKRQALHRHRGLAASCTSARCSAWRC